MFRSLLQRPPPLPTSTQWTIPPLLIEKTLAARSLWLPVALQPYTRASKRVHLIPTSPVSIPHRQKRDFSAEDVYAYDGEVIMEGVLEKYQDLLEADQIQIGCIVHEQHSNLSQLYAPLEHIFKEGTSIDRTADLAAYLAKISKFANDNVLLKASGVNCSTGLLLMFDVYAATHKFSEYSTNITYLTPTSTLPTTQETILPLSPLEIQQELSTFFSELGLGDFKWSLISTGDLQCDAGLQQLPIPPLLLPRYIDILKRGLYALQKEYIESSMLNSRRYAEAVQVECRDSMNSVECVVADRREVAIIAEELVRNGWRTASLGSTGA